MPIEGVSNYVVLIAFVISLTIVVIGVLISAVLLAFKKIEYSVAAVAVTIPFVVIALAIWFGRDVKNIVDEGQPSQTFEWVGKIMNGILSFEGGGILDTIFPWWIFGFYAPLAMVRVTRVTPVILKPLLTPLVAAWVDGNLLSPLKRVITMARELPTLLYPRQSLLVTVSRKMRRQQR